eukprot:1156632-Pelagomonas_calceolata.AAC.11
MRLYRRPGQHVEAPLSRPYSSISHHESKEYKAASHGRTALPFTIKKCNATTTAQGIQESRPIIPWTTAAFRPQLTASMRATNGQP